MSFRDVMVDLETLGTVPGSTILSIGAVAFDAATGRTADFGFEIILDRETCRLHGLIEDQATLAWWNEQPRHVAQIVDLASQPGVAVPLREALDDFTAYLRRYGDDVRLWGNGAAFDNALLACAYRAAGLSPPWRFFNDRCYRTLKALHPEIALRRIGNHHDALDDARSQAEHAIRLLRRVAEPRSLIARFRALAGVA